MKKVVFTIVILLSISVLGIFSYNLMNTQEGQTKPNIEEIPPMNKELEEKETPSTNIIEGSFPHNSIDYLKDNSTHIVQGQPVEVLNSFMKQGDIPFTEFLFEVDKDFKGNSKEEMKIIQDGNTEEEYRSHPLMELNSKYILFLEELPTGELVMLGGPTAKFDFNPAEEEFTNSSGVILDEDLNVKK